MRGLFVTGTGTGVGKSVVAAAICAALSSRGERVGAFKPVLTGLEEEPGTFGRDHELLAEACGRAQSPEEVAPYRYGPPVSPHYAAELAGEVVDAARLVEHARGLGRRFDALVAEGVGGLLVPLTPGFLVRDLARELSLPVVIAASPGLGTINHTLLTVEAARAVGLNVRGVVMTPWPDAPAGIELSNRATVERLGGVMVSGLARTGRRSLAEAGAGLPLDDWL
ncbi:MAG TPA: dethiobiotin synthase [Thermoleophilaceae bacterium]|nr:dethiobiotin synthase [Thermoleophilaceae bacterium]